MNKHDRLQAADALENIRSDVKGKAARDTLDDVIRVLWYGSQSRAELIDEVLYARRVGLSVRDIATKYGVSSWSVYRWIKRHRESTGEDLSRPVGRPLGS